jgi:predicted transcriptional regulator
MMDLGSYHEDHNSMLMWRELVDPNIYRIIMSTINIAKTVSQICHENELPMSSTYKNIQKLYKSGLISIEKINFDHKGRKVILYRSKIKSLQISISDAGISLQIQKK